MQKNRTPQTLVGGFHLSTGMLRYFRYTTIQYRRVLQRCRSKARNKNHEASAVESATSSIRQHTKGC